MTPLPWTACSFQACDLVLCAQAANYLNIETLLDLACQTVANMIKGELRGLECRVTDSLAAQADRLTIGNHWYRQDSRGD